ncbi:hypothetical protein NPIL_448291 [Nephila pilipes]|uniref:Uncharacterized protein n=1 Tax=Nephila pilipes TaxID=299642 RepID=A0A8X6MEV9_NEPPI|nr:hypothetical protein NPIL_448291 [Nephila pilipes]
MEHIIIKPFTSRGALTEELFELFVKTMWVTSTIALAKWMEYFSKYYEQLTASPFTYIIYVSHACHVVRVCATDCYARFINVCSVVIAAGLYVYCTAGLDFYKLTPRILTVGFENALLYEFLLGGGWKRFRRYLSTGAYIKWHDKCHGVESDMISEGIQLQFAMHVSYAMEQENYNPYYISGRELEKRPDNIKLAQCVLSSFEDSFLREINSPSRQKQSIASREKLGEAYSIFIAIAIFKLKTAKSKNSILSIVDLINRANPQEMETFMEKLFLEVAVIAPCNDLEPVEYKLSVKGLLARDVKGLIEHSKAPVAYLTSLYDTISLQITLI